MNQPIKKRGILAGLGALVTAAALALSGAAAAQAVTLDDMPESSRVVITKLSQPESLGDAATGEAADAAAIAGLDGIGGVIFDYYLVPGIDLGANAGQAAAGALTLQEAQERIAAVETGSFPATNAPSGITEATLPRGLYLVKERASSVPSGVTAAAPFLLSVPLTDPTNRDQWLDTIYVYPKNSRIAGTKTVENAAQLVVGNDITWTIATDIPRVANPATTGANDQFSAPDYFRIDDTLQNDELAFVRATVTAGTTPLTEGVDYTITPVASDPVGATTYQILFIDAGRAALAAAVNANPLAQVAVSLTTTVLKADVIDNAASVYPNQSAVEGNNPLPIQAVEAKYGSLGVQKLSTSNDPEVNLAGAEFRVYSSAADAKAANDKYLKPTSNTAGVWKTDAQGQFVIAGLRYSEFADGVEQLEETDGSKFQAYYLVETKALAGHQLLAEPIKFEIDSSTGAIALNVTNQENTGGFVLPLTGGMGTALITLAGITLLAVVLVVARRRRSHEAAAE